MSCWTNWNRNKLNLIVAKYLLLNSITKFVFIWRNIYIFIFSFWYKTRLFFYHKVFDILSLKLLHVARPLLTPDNSHPFKSCTWHISPIFSIWTRVLNHNKYVEIKQFSKVDIKENNISTVILLIKFLVYQWDPRHLQGSRVVYILVNICSI